MGSGDRREDWWRGGMEITVPEKQLKKAQKKIRAIIIQTIAPAHPYEKLFIYFDKIFTKLFLKTAVKEKITMKNK